MKRCIILTLISVYLLDLQGQTSYSDKCCFDSSLAIVEESACEEGPQEDCIDEADSKRATTKEFSIWKVSGRMVRKMLTENARVAEVNSKEVEERSVLLAEHKKVVKEE